MIADLHEEGGLNLPTILADLEGADEVPDGLDLRYAPLDGEQLDEVNLYAVNLTGGFLSGTRMQKADLRDARLEGATLEGADLRGAYLSNCDLAGALLKGANLSGAMLDGANLAGANMTGSTCIDAYFAGATLDGADLRQSNLSQADFTNVSCRGLAVSQGTLERLSVPPSDRSTVVIEPSPSRAHSRAGLTRRRGAQQSGGRRRPNGGDPRSRATMPLRRPASGRSEVQPRQNFGRSNGGAPLRDWDLALSKLLPLRRQVTRITIVIDGEEQVLFES